MTMFFNCSLCLAFSDHRDNDNPYGYVNPNSPQSNGENERRQRFKLAMNYARKELPNFLPGLPSGLLHNPVTWMSGGWMPNDRFMDFGAQQDADNLASFLQPVQSVLRKPDNNVSQAFWLTPDYHHRGFLPFQDSLVFGFHMRSTPASDLFHNSLQIDVHPFYGQNWHSEANYWGTEVSMDLTSDNASKPWGKIALRFSQGDTNLMDRGQGFDMHSEMNFDDHLSLNAGMRENGRSEAGNYAMLRWKMSLGD